MGADAKATVAVWLKVRGESVIDDLLEACDRLYSTEGEVILDFSSVRRIDARAVAALDQLAACAEEEGINVVLRGMNVEVYKVLKLVKLTSHFTFVNGGR